MPSSPESETTGPEQGEQTSEVDSLRQRNAELEDRYMRALADLDNYRKRAMRDVDRRAGENREAILRDWLEVVDGVDRALAMQPENPNAEGLRRVLEQMEAILARQGVRRIGERGERFDPERHEAVAVRETDEAPDQTILDIARSGFAIGDRVLRPAEVIVATGGGRGD